MPAASEQIASMDLAGTCMAYPQYLHIRARINHLIDRYLTIEILSDRLSDLPSQFTQPQPRRWEPIRWQDIDRSQIIGIDPDLFVQVVAGATEVEAPIRAYAQESWGYLQSLHPELAYFMGGKFGPDGSTLEVGVWEKEERQHAPVFSKIYQCLTGEKLRPEANSVLGYQPTQDAWTDLHDHVLTRISTEWGAASVYLWLMAHSTGALQQAIAQPLQDEVNHLAKFWGFSRWAFADPYLKQLKFSTQAIFELLKHHKGERTHGEEVLGQVLSLETVSHGVALTFTMMRVMVRLRAWNRELTDSYLKHLFGQPIMSRDRHLAA